MLQHTKFVCALDSLNNVQRLSVFKFAITITKIISCVEIVSSFIFLEISDVCTFSVPCVFSYMIVTRAFIRYFMACRKKKVSN